MRMKLVIFIIMVILNVNNQSKDCFSEEKVPSPAFTSRDVKIGDAVYRDLAAEKGEKFTGDKYRNPFRKPVELIVEPEKKSVKKEEPKSEAEVVQVKPELEGIVWSNGKDYAILNGEVVGEGDKTKYGEVTAISEYMVKIRDQSGNEIKILRK
ncbi:MAG: hypothetical protein HQL30_08185 [Candidatus Omnitrophica bacterium]|nr:hypothetical protein [Candidatus Omnitrophota bacterium]